MIPKIHVIRRVAKSSVHPLYLTPSELRLPRARILQLGPLVPIKLITETFSPGPPRTDITWKFYLYMTIPLL